MLKTKLASVRDFDSFRGAFLPMKPTADHQVEHEPEIVLQTNGDAFANPPQLQHLLTLCLVIGGWAVRKSEGPVICTRSRVRPRIRFSSASM